MVEMAAVGCPDISKAGDQFEHSGKYDAIEKKVKRAASFGSTPEYFLMNFSTLSYRAHVEPYELGSDGR
jgi:hypothetical protein